MKEELKSWLMYMAAVWIAICALGLVQRLYLEL
jgi:hypothetical protein